MTDKETFEKCLTEIQKYEKKNFFAPKYLFINPTTYEHLKDYVKEQGFYIARELGHITEYFMAVEIIVCDIKDDEIIVGG